MTDQYMLTMKAIPKICLLRLKKMAEDFTLASKSWGEAIHQTSHDGRTPLTEGH